MYMLIYKHCLKSYKTTIVLAKTLLYIHILDNAETSLMNVESNPNSTLLIFFSFKVMIKKKFVNVL